MRRSCYNCVQYFEPDFSTQVSWHIFPVYFLSIVCSRSVGRGLRAEVYVMVECSYFAYTSQLTVCHRDGWGKLDRRCVD